MATPHIAILGGSGLIGHALALDLARSGFAVRAHARRFTAPQMSAFGERAVQSPLMSLSEDALAKLLGDADIVINCVGVLQDGPGGSTDTVHRAFAATLATVCARDPKRLLLHASVPGDPLADATAYSLSKRDAERAIAASGAPFVILRPGFVIAPAAYGGSALVRALAALPFRLPKREADAPFAGVAIEDICETVARVAARWRGGETEWNRTWDVMEESPGRLGGIIEAFRAHGGGPAPFLMLPGWLLDLGGWAGDLASWLGWKPPVRSTAIHEMRRGVTGDPRAWIAETGIAPSSAQAIVSALPVTVQEKWFARLYLIKALALATLVLFWCISALIALTVSFSSAREILLAHGFPFKLANAITIGSGLTDFLVGSAIAWRRSCRFGLIAGIAVSLFYMTAAAILTPDLWIEPLGALVKTGPAIVLMLVCLAILDDR
jgi:uncharacterized protein YbjT (DUF2867 family)